MGATFAGTRSVVANTRQVDDSLNGVAGGCAAGFLAGIRCTCTLTLHFRVEFADTPYVAPLSLLRLTQHVLYQWPSAAVLSLLLLWEHSSTQGTRCRETSRCRSRRDGGDSSSMNHHRLQVPQLRTLLLLLLRLRQYKTQHFFTVPFLPSFMQ